MTHIIRITLTIVLVGFALYAWDVASHARDCSWRSPNFGPDYRCSMAPDWVWDALRPSIGRPVD